MWQRITPSRRQTRLLMSGPTIQDPPPRPGDALICSASNAAVDLGNVISSRIRWPWLPIVVVDENTTIVEAAAQGAPCPWGCIAIPRGASMDDAIAALRSRIAPELSDVLDLLGAILVDGPFAAQVGNALGSRTIHRSTTSRRLRLVTRIRRRDWTHLAWMVGAAHRLGGFGARPGQGRWTVDRIANELGCDVRTLRRRLWLVAESTVARLRAEVVWEWVVAEFARTTFGIDVCTGNVDLMTIRRPNTYAPGCESR
jgi:hypothetical protein